jgi:hypothetical protein
MRVATRYRFLATRAYYARRVVRGGSYWNNARRCRSAYRNANEPGNRNRNQGFRLAAAHPLEVRAADPALVAPDLGPARLARLRVLVVARRRERTLPKTQCVYLVAADVSLLTNTVRADLRRLLRLNDERRRWQ